MGLSEVGKISPFSRLIFCTGQSHACFCILLSDIQSEICEIDVTAVLGAASEEELERLLRELDPGSGAELEPKSQS